MLAFSIYILPTFNTYNRWIQVKSDVSIINSITYNIYKYLKNPVSAEVEMSSLYKDEYSYRHCLYLLWLNPLSRSFDILLWSQLWIHIIKDKTYLFPRILDYLKKSLGVWGKCSIRHAPSK